jgi:hypothetical protein
MVKNLRFAIILSALAVLLIAAAAPVAASHTLSRANIPFDFVLNGKAMPAGTYQFQSGEWKGLMSVFDREGRRHMLPVMPLGSPGVLQNPRVVFERAGATYRLSEIWFSNGIAGRASLPRTKGAPAGVQVAIQLL